MTNDPKNPEYNAKARDAIMDLCPFYDPNHKCGIVRAHVFKDFLTELRERNRLMENELASARASASTYREQYEASEMNIKNLMHYAKGLPDHVAISSPAIPIRDALLLLHADKADIETKWEELCKAIGAHGPESDPLTGSDTNDKIHERAMERIREMVSDEF